MLRTLRYRSWGCSWLSLFRIVDITLSLVGRRCSVMEVCTVKFRNWGVLRRVWWGSIRITLGRRRWTLFVTGCVRWVKGSRGLVLCYKSRWRGEWCVGSTWSGTCWSYISIFGGKSAIDDCSCFYKVMLRWGVNVVLVQESTIILENTCIAQMLFRYWRCVRD